MNRDDMPPFQLVLGDCIAGMSSLPDGAVDHCLTDPPYDEHTHANATDHAGDRIAIDFDHLTSLAHVREALRVAKRWVVCFCALEQLGDYQIKAGESWVRSGVWVRTNGAPQLSGDRPAQGAEGVFIGHRPGKKAWNGGGNRAAWTGPRETDSEHPTQKPLWLMERLILDFTDPGDVVLDPFMGSGTTGVAAIRHGRRFIGFERDPKYFAIAERRISETREQFSLRLPKKSKKSTQERLL